MSMESIRLKVETVRGKHNVKELKRELDTIRGVTSVSVSGNIVAVDYDATGANRDMIIEKMEKLGYDVSELKLENQNV